MATWREIELADQFGTTKSIKSSLQKVILNSGEVGERSIPIVINLNQLVMSVSEIFRHMYLLAHNKANPCRHPCWKQGDTRDTVCGSGIVVDDEKKKRRQKTFLTEQIWEANRLSFYFVKSNAAGARRLIDKVRWYCCQSVLDGSSFHCEE